MSIHFPESPAAMYLDLLKHPQNHKLITQQSMTSISLAICSMCVSYQTFMTCAFGHTVLLASHGPCFILFDWETLYPPSNMTALVRRLGLPADSSSLSSVPLQHFLHFSIIEQRECHQCLYSFFPQ